MRVFWMAGLYARAGLAPSLARRGAVAAHHAPAEPPPAPAVPALFSERCAGAADGEGGAPPQRKFPDPFFPAADLVRHSARPAATRARGSAVGGREARSLSAAASIGGHVEPKS